MPWSRRPSSSGWVTFWATGERRRPHPAALSRGRRRPALARGEVPHPLRRARGPRERDPRRALLRHGVPPRGEADPVLDEDRGEAAADVVLRSGSGRRAREGARMGRGAVRAEEGRMRPSSLPPPEQFAHGTRARYVGGCHCRRCCVANTAYGCARRVRERARSPLADPFVSARPVARHLRALSRKGVGTPSVAAASDMSSSSVWKILAGTTRRVRASTARRIFAVDVPATADGSRIDARPTWVLVRQMVAAGFTKAELGLRLGHVIPKLDLGRKLVRARTAHLIRRLHA